MSDINDLNLLEEDAPAAEDLNDQPAQFGGFFPDPQPGTYRFKLPAEGAMRGIWDVIADKEGKQRIRATFKDDAALMNLSTNQPFRVNLSNIPMPRGKDKKLASDLGLLLGSGLGVTTTPANNREWAEALIAKANHTFLADIDWDGYCSPQKDIYKADPADGKNKKVEGTKGCGNRFRTYQGKQPNEYLIPKNPDGSYADRFFCPCGASIKVFAKLSNFRGGK